MNKIVVLFIQVMIYIYFEVLSPVSVISNLIAKIVKTKKPKTRYVAGKLAKPMM